MKPRRPDEPNTEGPGQTDDAKNGSLMIHDSDAQNCRLDIPVRLWLDGSRIRENSDLTWNTSEFSRIRLRRTFRRAGTPILLKLITKELSRESRSALTK